MKDVTNLVDENMFERTKNYLISQDKIERELENYKKKPKKKGGFSERLGEMMKEQQRIAEQRNNSKK